MLAARCHSRLAQDRNQQRHADIHAMLGLAEVDSARIEVAFLGDLAGAGERVHEDHVGLGLEEGLWCDLVRGLDLLVLGRVVEALALHSRHVHHVGVRNHVVYVVVLRHRDAAGLDEGDNFSGHLQALGRDELELDVVERHNLGKRVDRAPVLEVADKRYCQAVDRPNLLADGIDVEQSLGRVLAGAVASVDDGLLHLGRHASDRALLRVAQHNDVGVALHDADEVLERLALGHGRGALVVDAHDRAAEALHGRGERARGARGGFVENARHRHPLQDVDRAPRREDPQVVREVEQLVQEVAVELLNGQHMLPLEVREHSPGVKRPRRGRGLAEERAFERGAGRAGALRQRDAVDVGWSARRRRGPASLVGLCEGGAALAEGAAGEGGAGLAHADALLRGRRGGAHDLGRGGGVGLLDQAPHLRTHPRVREHLPVEERQLAAQHDARHGPDDLAARKRRPAALALRHGVRELPRAIEVEHDVGVGLLGEAEDAARVGVEARHDVVEREAALRHRRQQQRQHRLEAREARRRRRGLLLLLGVRRVVRREDVDDVHVLPQRLHVLVRRQPRPHVGHALGQRRDVRVGEEEVVRGHAARHLGAAPLRLAHHHDLLAPRQRADVDRAVVHHGHHEHRRERLGLGAHDDRQLRGPRLKVRHPHREVVDLQLVRRRVVQLHA
mmetsp:Transcript_41137/g.96717  ORF Transcript_41137/g.96717 Transcript_41137/m.96717 type:complete len:675 (+) Transcript_41137:156-2180(+)